MADSGIALSPSDLRPLPDRVIPNVMNQFGCPYAKDPNASDAGTGNPPDGLFGNLAKNGAVEKRFGGGNIKDECVSQDSNTPGSLSMANTGMPRTCRAHAAHMPCTCRAYAVHTSCSR